MIATYKPIDFRCPLGKWAPPGGNVPVMSFFGCPYVCPAGYFGATDNLTTSSCSGLCPAGTYCPEGSSEAKNCPAGTYLPVGVPGLHELSCIPCAPGTYSTTEGLISDTGCTPCPAGSLSESLSSTSCDPCPKGGYCSEPNSATTRQTYNSCPAGTYNPDTGSATNASCLACPPGKANPIPGSSDPLVCIDCLPGSFAATNGTGVCSLCPAGQYQDLPGKTGCKPCTRGYYCEVGTAKPTPCSAGTASNVTGLSDPSSCVFVLEGFWAPLGSALPKPCPSSGFYCPGAEEDDLYGGAEPIIMPTGGSTETQDVEVVEQQMTLSIDCNTFDLAVFKQTLADQYQVNVALIEVDDPCASSSRRRRRLQQSVSITISIASSGTAADGTPISAPVANLLTAVSSIDDTALGSALGSALGVPISIVSTPPTTANVTVTVQLDCPKGKWCTAGLIVDCPLDTYNNLTKQEYAIACNRCPANSHTEHDASTSIDDCKCDAHYYDTIIGPGVVCSVCPSGTDCKSGATLDQLPLKPSYYRLTNMTIDVLKCPDYDANCSTTFGTSECVSTSACRGGTSVDDQCNSSFTGIKADSIFCRVCAPPPSGSSSELVYYAKATDEEPAKCAACGDRLVSTVVFLILGLLLLSFAIAIAYHTWRAHPARIRWFAHTFSPLAKLKILFSFYMVVTKIDTIYEVSMPLEVRRPLAQLSRVVSIGLTAPELSTVPLECVGLAGYTPKLIFWMVLPVGFTAAILAFVVAQRAYVRRQQWGRERALVAEAAQAGNRKSSPPARGEAATTATFLESALPWFLQAMFLLYPNVTNIAFDGLSPCYELDDGSGVTRGFMIADVGIECRTPEHERVRMLAWLAVFAYPIGLMALNTLLLFKARRSIIGSDHSTLTPLARSITFLYRDFDLLCFWWEIAEMLRKFLLVGIMVVIEPGTIMQLVLGTIISAAFFLVQMQAQPYRNPTDDFLASASSFSMTMVFLCSIVYKYAALTDTQDVRDKMSSEQKSDYIVPSYVISIVLVISVFGSLVLTAILLFHQAMAERNNIRRLARSSRARRLRRRKGAAGGASLGQQGLAAAAGEEVDPPTIAADEYHLFLSHTWAQGQEEMRVVKTRLREMMPLVQVFLDVDDLKIGAGAEYIDKSHSMLCVCTARYFESRACARELFRALLQGKPLICLLEPNRTEAKGGLTEAEIRAIVTEPSWVSHWKLDGEVSAWGEAWGRPGLTPPTGDEIAEALFASGVIEWNNFSAFQDVTLRLIAERLLPEKLRGNVYVQGEIGSAVLTMPRPSAGRAYVLYCSEHNVNALALVKELQEVLFSKSTTPFAVTSDIRQLEHCDHFLLYLTSKTWTSGETSVAFAREVAQAHRMGVHLLPVHEFPNAIEDESVRDACAFNDFWKDGWTPRHLLQGPANVYKQIAIALKAGPWRLPGLTIVAQKMMEGDSKRTPIKIDAEAEENGLRLMWEAQMNDDSAGGATPGAGAQGATVAPSRPSQLQELSGESERASTQVKTKSRFIRTLGAVGRVWAERGEGGRRKRSDEPSDGQPTVMMNVDDGGGRERAFVVTV